jgi:hypothetical protein
MTDIGMKCNDCRLSVTLLINCEGCFHMVCRPCHDIRHHHGGL